MMSSGEPGPLPAAPPPTAAAAAAKKKDQDSSPSSSSEGGHGAGDEVVDQKIQPTKDSSIAASDGKCYLVRVASRLPRVQSPEPTRAEDAKFPRLAGR